jgi:hypothetical protein
MGNTAKKELHDLVDALPPAEAQAARRYLEYLRDSSDPYALLDGRDPFESMLDGERAELHAALERAEAEIAAGKGTAAGEFLRELRAAR